jgi:predicted O-methyltransferase YrrM
MIEKIGLERYVAISEPCKEVLELIEILKESKDQITVGEIGVGIGATSVEILKRLDYGDIYYMFSYEDDVNELKNDLENINDKNVKIIAEGNSTKTFDSYNWNLAKLALTEQKEGRNGIFDLIYLDGAHTFFHDATACCCIKKLLRTGGYVIFDDMFWSFANSSGLNPIKKPRILDMYTMEQIEAYQIEMVVSLFMEPDNDFIRVNKDDRAWRSIWRRIK